MTRLADQIEDVQGFRERSRQWLGTHMSRLDAEVSQSRVPTLLNEKERLDRHRVLQRRLFEGGFAGLCFPREYGGQGLTPAHQAAFTEESAGYEMPVAFNVPTLGILAATILDCGTEAQKIRHLPAILRGDEYWIQFLSEPSGGSDVAGALTTAIRDGEEWIVNGSKIWSTRAWQCDYALLLARTNWDVPKHRGLSVFIVKIHQPGIEVQQIEMLNGSREFCQEFFTDLRIPAENLVGEVDEGWSVATQWMYHERNAVGGGSPYVSGIGGDGAHGVDDHLVHLARATGQIDDPSVRDLVAEDYVLGTIQDQLIERVTKAIDQQRLPPTAAGLMRLYRGVMGIRAATIGFEIAGTGAGMWSEEDADIGSFGTAFLMRQVRAIGGGSLEMARNVISERLLGMPREAAPDAGRPFREARRNQGEGSEQARPI